MSDEAKHVAKWTGMDKQKVSGVGVFFPGEEVPIDGLQAERLRGVSDERFLIDGEPSYVPPDESAEMKGKIPAEKKPQLKDAAKEMVDEGALPPEEADIAVKSNLKKKGGK